MGKILVLGDSILDVYLSGISTRRSPEANAPIVDLKSTEYRLGGAANVFANCKSLGGDVFFASCVGDDIGGRKIKELLESIGTTKLFESKITTVKTRIYSNGKYLCRVDEDATEQCNFDLTGIFGNQSIVVLSDYNKGFFNSRSLRDILGAYSNTYWFIVDGKNPDLSSYSGAYLITPNLNESLILTGTSDPDVAAQKMLKFVENVLITKSEHGMTLYTNSGKVDFPALCKDPISFIGAGDQIVAGVSVGLSEGMSLVDSLHFANDVVRVGLSKPLTPIVYRNEICIQN